MKEQSESSKTKRSVFISHASKNFKVADSIRSILEERGVSCWIAPRDIQAGKQYGTSIIDGISNSTVFLLLLTEESNLSVAVQNEVERAFGYQKTIIPVRISNVKPGKEIEFFVSNAQWVDAIYQPLKRRMDEVAAIVQAIEMSAKPQPVQPEKKTLLGIAERVLEGMFRHKTLSFVSGFIAVLGLSAFGIHMQTQGVEKVDRASVKIEQSGQKINTAAESIQESSGKVAALGTAIGEVKKEVSDDPRKELVARGYSIDSRGLRSAIANGDLIGISQFNKMSYVTETSEIIKEIFYGSWNINVANAIDPSVVRAVCKYTPIQALEISEKTPGSEQLHIDKLKAMQRLCGTEKIRELLTSRAKEISEGDKLLAQLESNAGLLKQSIYGNEKEAIALARLEINPNKYSKLAQHQKPASVENREYGKCGQPNWACTYAGEGLSPEEFKDFEKKKLSQVNERQSSDEAALAKVKKSLAMLK